MSILASTPVVPLEATSWSPTGPSWSASRVRDPGLDLREVPHPADQQGHDRAPEAIRNEFAELTRPSPTRRRVGLQGATTTPSTRRPASARRLASMVPRSCRRRATRRRPRRTASSSTPTRRSRPTARLRWPRCRDVGSLATTPAAASWVIHGRRRAPGPCGRALPRRPGGPLMDLGEAPPRR